MGHIPLSASEYTNILSERLRSGEEITDAFREELISFLELQQTKLDLSVLLHNRLQEQSGTLVNEERVSPNPFKMDVRGFKLGEVWVDRRSRKFIGLGYGSKFTLVASPSGAVRSVSPLNARSWIRENHGRLVQEGV